MILLTGASGKTGKAILQALTKRKVDVRVFVRTNEQANYLQQVGAKESIIGDLQNVASLQQAMLGCNSLYYICPNVSPDELEIGNTLLEIARKENVNHFVYHSVIHPQIEAMPHHWQKMRMEESIFKSRLNFTILQPCAYMQNIQSNLQSILTQKTYEIPYSTTARISIVDLNDIAEVAALVLTEGDKHQNAIYELAGPQPLSQDEVAATINAVFNKEVIAKSIDRKLWAANAKNGSLTDSQIDILVMMFEYYEKYGLIGNSYVLDRLLRRPATTFASYLNQFIPL